MPSDTVYDATGAIRNLDGYFKNTIVAHSTMQNYGSVRFPTNGTPYIQNFCEAFEQGQSLNIIDFFMDLADRVKECRHEATRKTWVITPEIRILGVMTLHKSSSAQHAAC